MRFAGVLGLVAALAGVPAAAYDADGIIYDMTCSEEGYSLTSRHPVLRRVRPPEAMTQIVEGQETIRLGRYCDAYHEAFGVGSWCWANGGFFATFPLHEFRFSGQELSCRQGTTPEADCRC